MAAKEQVAQKVAEKVETPNADKAPAKSESVETLQKSVTRLEAITRKQNKRIDSIVNACEQMFGWDIDGDGLVAGVARALVLFLLAGALIGSANAGSEPIQSFQDTVGGADVWSITTDNDGSIDVEILGTLLVTNTVIISNTLTVAGAITANGDQTINGAQTVTNGSTVVAGGINVTGNSTFSNDVIHVGVTTHTGVSTNTGNVVNSGTLLQVGNGTFTADILANGDITGDNATDISAINDITYSGNFNGGAVALTVSQTFVITNTSGDTFVLLPSAAQVTGTLLNAGTQYDKILIINAARTGTTNIYFLDAGNLEGVTTLGIEDTAEYFALETNQWIKTGSFDNTP